MDNFKLLNFEKTFELLLKKLEYEKISMLNYVRKKLFIQ
jgi:hypothetical protein